MLFQDNFNFDDCIGRQTFLYGETNTGKTYFTAKFIDFLLDSNLFAPKEISILDFAPKFLDIPWELGHLMRFMEE